MTFPLQGAGSFSRRHMAAEKISVDGRVSSAIDRLKDLIDEDGQAEMAAQPEPRNVEEAVVRLKRKVDDKSD